MFAYHRNISVLNVFSVLLIWENYSMNLIHFSRYKIAFLWPLVSISKLTNFCFKTDNAFNHVCLTKHNDENGKCLFKFTWTVNTIWSIDFAVFPHKPKSIKPTLNEISYTFWEFFVLVIVIFAVKTWLFEQ